MKLMLDTSVLLEVCAPGRYEETKEWFRRILLATSPPELLVSVLTDFELRRAFQRRGAVRSLEHLEEVSQSLRLVPLSAAATRRAASLCSTSEPPIPDVDALVAAQAVLEGAVLVTDDEGLRAVQGLDARAWQDVEPVRAIGIVPGGASVPESS